jgi:hypothetical protein
MTDNIHKLLEGEETVNPYETLKPFYEVVTA